MNDSRHQHTTVLIADDDPRVRAVAEVVLRRAGHVVVKAASAADAIAAAGTHPDIDVALIDIVMPDMTGYDLATRLRQLTPRIHVVFTSGSTSDWFRQPIHELFVAKPFTIESLTGAIEEALAR